MLRALRIAFVSVSFCAWGCGNGAGDGDEACGPDTCDTCCTAGGNCAPEVSSYNCGDAGEQCVDCQGAVCEAGGTCGPPPKRFFVTSAVYTGDLATAGGAATGVEGGDALCAEVAASVLPGSTWRAWLSDSTHDAIDRVTDVGPWHLFNGNVAFADKASLTDFSAYAVDFDEEGHQVSGEEWTGTNLDGTARANTCSDWTSGNNGFGDAATSWGMTTPRNCFQEKPLFCIQQ